VLNRHDKEIHGNVLIKGYYLFSDRLSRRITIAARNSKEAHARSSRIPLSLKYRNPLFAIAYR
jgi:hypothetical protein